MANTPQKRREDMETESSPRFPSVNERLGHLRPSRELLEYYRRKIAEYDDEHEEMTHKLDQYKCTYEEQHKSRWELRQREEEIAELQKALSDMQVYLFQEREHVLRLYAENDRLKIRELEDRKKIQHLLNLPHGREPEITYFHKQPPARAVVGQHHNMPSSPRHTGRGPGGHKKALKKSAAREDGNHRHQPQSKDNQTLLLQIETLQAQLEEQTKLSKDQVESLLEDRRVRLEEQNAQRERDTDKIKSLQDNLHRAQDLLYDSTKDFLELKYELRAKERHWMVERDRLIQEIEHLRDQLDVSVNSATGVLDVSGPEAFEPRHAQQQALQSLKVQLEQSQKLAEMYREQCIGLEDELSRIREQTDVSKEIFKERSEKMGKRLELMNSRYESLEKRRALEVEGFKNDIRMLRNKLKDVEKQLFKVTVNMGEDFDRQVLQSVRGTASRSKKLVGDLHTLKAKIYAMENDIRHLG